MDKQQHMTIGQLAYRVYAKYMNDGSEWENLMKHERVAWQATGEALVDCCHREAAIETLLEVITLELNQGTQAVKSIHAALSKCPSWPEFSIAAWSHLVAEVARCASALPVDNERAWAWVAKQARALEGLC